MSEPAETQFPAPGPEAAYRAHLESGRFCIQKCGGCAGHVFPPRQVCPHCGGPELEWMSPSGDATVYAVTVVNRREEQGGVYNVVLADLKEGPRMMSRVEGLPHDQVTIGLALRARIASDEGNGPYIVFDPAAGGAGS